MPFYYSRLLSMCSLFSLAFCLPVLADSTMQRYDNFNNVQFVKNYDGDSITFNIPNTPAIVGENIVIRLRGIDAPELRTKSCPAEKEKAKQAKELVYSLLTNAKAIHLHRIARGKYFRMLADVEFDGRDLATALLNQNLAVQYSGGKRKNNWCPEGNRQSSAQNNSPPVLPPKVSGVYVWPPPPVQKQDSTKTKQ